MKKIFIIAITTGYIIFTQGCYYNKQEIINPSVEDCDTSRITYSLTVSPIISKHCLTCHDTNHYKTEGGNLNLEGYSNTIVAVNYGLLLKSIQHEAGVSPMPKNTSKLSDCDILKIKKWIDAGAANN